MSRSVLEQDVGLVCDLVRSRMNSDTKTIIGIAGPPASGKSTLAERVVQSFAGGTVALQQAVLLPMDGYHLNNNVLKSRGLLARKGAPETFDANGFCNAVKRLPGAKKRSFHPVFDRDRDVAIANAISIEPETPIIVVEGNYLLLKEQPWSLLNQVFSATVFIAPPMEKLFERLQQRWINHGFDPATARQRAVENDLLNAEFVLANSRDADLHLT